MKPKLILHFCGIILCFLVAINITVYYYKTTLSIEQQIAQKLGITETDVFLFDTQKVDEYQIAGICYASNQYGIVWMHNKKYGPELIWIKTSEKMACRANKVWVTPISIKENHFCAFLSDNSDLSSIILEDKNNTMIAKVDHVPALKIIFHEIGRNYYQLKDAEGFIIQ